MRAATWFGLAALAAVGLMTPGSQRAQGQTTGPAKPGIANSLKIPAALPPDVAFGRSIALIRGHLLTGDELVKRREWSEAHPHFMFPLEEIYGVIREDLRGYHTPPFDGALRALARMVAARNARQYPKAFEKVERSLAAADAGLKARQPDWPRFVAETAVAVLKTAPEEYADAIANDRIAHPVGYQTARGFILQADRMIESAAAGLEAKNAEALRDMRGGFAQLKQAFAAVNAPQRPPIDADTMLSIILRIELAAAKLQ
jgi:hypothetical protein